MSAELDRLTASVTANTDVEESAIQFIVNVSQQLRDAIAANNPAALAALANTLDTERQKLADAITANTPAA